MARKAKTTSAETLEPKDNKVYEIGFLMSPAVRDEDLAARTDELKESLTNIGATFISEGAPEFIDLAYEMSKIIDNKRVRFNQGYFGWVKFEVSPTNIAAVKEAIEKNLLIIRYLLIIAPRENTILGKKPLGKILKGERSAVVEGEAEAEIPVEKLDEVLDEEIKELVKEA
ncbi:MAG: 30S ribosomal protein S6 [bacterium]|jgi:ribosomal protein S6